MKKKLLSAACIMILFLISSNGFAQNNKAINLQDLSAFENPGESWTIAGEVIASLEEPNAITTSEGSGILVNNPEDHQGEDLFMSIEHGDIDLELDFMMAKESNSGIYLQGRYELQLLDSWAVKVPTSGDNGGIYERWDESRPEGEKGYEGYPPRQNASRAPGVWQHLEVSFRAPRFDANGNKIENAKIIRAELNGVTIHEDLELFGPTRGAVGNDEVASGPLRFQGDHGAIAFRNINITRYDWPAPIVKNLEYKVFEGTFTEEPDTDTLSAVKSGNSESLTTSLGPLPDQFLLQYKGTIQNRHAGDYEFRLNVSDGTGLLRIDGDEIIDVENNEDSVKLPKGEVPFEMQYAMQGSGEDPDFELSVSGEGLRSNILNDKMIRQGGGTNIFVKASEKPLLRSFMDLPNGTRITHGISVSSLEKIHYTYDLKHGNLVQLWRGNFLNATPMWYNRGDGSSRPEGTVEHLIDEPSLAINKLENEQAAWSSDTSGTDFKSRGYRLDKNENPLFNYEIYGADVSDKVRVVNDGRGVQRTITLEDATDNLYIRLATGTSIKKGENNRYLIDDQSYYLKIDDPIDSEPIVRTVEGRQELIIPAQSTLNYTILF